MLLGLGFQPRWATSACRALTYITLLRAINYKNATNQALWSWLCHLLLAHCPVGPCIYRYTLSITRLEGLFLAHLCSEHV